MSSSSMLSEVRGPGPYRAERTEWVPQELFPIIPPSVAWSWVAGSGPNVSWCGSAASLSSSQITPGWTRACRRRGSSATTAFMYFEKSKTTAWLTVWPARPVPQPRPSTGAPCSRQAARAAATSSASRGTTTPIGTRRKTDASYAYRARACGPKSMSYHDLIAGLPSGAEVKPRRGRSRRGPANDSRQATPSAPASKRRRPAAIRWRRHGPGALSAATDRSSGPGPQA